MCMKLKETSHITGSCVPSSVSQVLLACGIVTLIESKYPTVFLNTSPIVNETIGAVGLVNISVSVVSFTLFVVFKNGLYAGCANPFNLSIFFQINLISALLVATTLNPILNERLVFL